MSRSFIQDVKEQPQVLETIASYYASAPGATLLASARGLVGGKHILLTGMGSSYAVARFAATYLWSFGMKAGYIEASELLHYGAKALFADTLLVLISQSGESVEIKEILNVLPEGVPTIGITGNPDSTLGTNAVVSLPIFSGEESTTSSKTYTSSAAVAFLLAQTLAGADTSEIIRTIRKASGDLSALLEPKFQGPANTAAEKLLNARNIHFIGRGPGYCTAFQGALTFKELVKIQVECMEAAQFRHGPMEAVRSDTVIVVFAPSGVTGSLLLSFAEELRSFGATVFVVRDGQLFEDVSHVPVTTGQTTVIDEFASTLTDIVPIQIIENGLAEQLGTTGSFQRITKVTSKE